MSKGETNRIRKKLKLTWKEIYQDFQQRHPNLKKEIVGFAPYDYATIVMWRKGGEKLIYNYDEHQVKFLRE